MKIKVEIQEKIYEVTIHDIHARPVIAEVDGVQYQVWPEEQASAPAVAAAAAPVVAPAAPEAAPAAPARAAVAAGASTLNAPLPGTIVAINVREGDSVEEGQELLTLEAMKMKNEIRADRAGVVARIHVNEGDLVKHGEALISWQG
ncbi:MAG TPA: biotin/lipoyl-binding protein [Anaerolineaceae bacterium]|nr:biotin/lipoyl-binding protein [Anaerolineaceae bacterium]HNZ14387.1 biotin/lipoyl-binding protein [Anaerolineaceae bacterium]HPX65745.1 biotin/lipoyl-binding protein [Anaerolineaceae bacterium]